MKIFAGISLFVLSAGILGAVATASPRQQGPGTPPKPPQDPDVTRRRAAYLLTHATTPYQVVFKFLPIDPMPVKGKSVDLRKQIADYGIPVKDQGNRGTCSVFALNFLNEYTACRKAGRKHPNFSEEYLNFAGNVAVGQFVDGGFFTDLNNGYQSYGHVAQSDLPYSDPMNPDVNAKGYKLMGAGEKAKRYPAKFLKPWDNTKGPTTAEMNAACSELDDGVPVASGLLWPDSGHFVQKTISGVDMMMKVPRSDVSDGHSIVLVGYKRGAQFPGGGYFIFRNSWGTSFGDKGYGYMAFAYCKAYANDMVCYP